MWISHAERPSSDEVCRALAIELGSKDFNADNTPSITTLVSSCQGLIIVDREGSIVRLIHFTLKEYLAAHTDIFSKPHSVMAEICLIYLNSQHVRALSANSWGNPFLKYCSLYWGVHAKRELSNRARSLALQLLGEYDGHISRSLLLQEIWYLPLKELDEYSLFSGLHCASLFGIVEAVAALIEAGCYDINQEDDLVNTPLGWAS